MHQDSLQELIEKIEERCRQNNILVFYGDIEVNSLTRVHWAQNGPTDWENYLNILLSSGAKIVTLAIERNHVEQDDYYLDYLESLEEEEQEEFKEALSTAQKTKGQIAQFTLTFFTGNVSYAYTKVAEWFYACALVESAYLSKDEETEDSEDDRLSEEEIEAAAREVITNPKYVNAKDRKERYKIATLLVKEKGIENEFDQYKVEKQAEQIFQHEIYPKLDEELGRKIKELKDKNLKKIEVRSRLGISETTLNRHWY